MIFEPFLYYSMLKYDKITVIFFNLKKLYWEVIIGHFFCILTVICPILGVEEGVKKVVELRNLVIHCSKIVKIIKIFIIIEKHD